MIEEHPAKTMKRLIPLFLLMTFVVGLMSGCNALARSAAEQPYRDALRDGRMSGSDYMQKKEEIRRASEPRN